MTGYVAMQMLVEAIKKANSIDSDKVAKALLDLTIDTPIGKQTIARQGSPGQSRPGLGQDGEGPEVSVRGHEGHHLHRSHAVHGLTRRGLRAPQSAAHSLERDRASDRLGASAQPLRRASGVTSVHDA